MINLPIFATMPISFVERFSNKINNLYLKNDSIGIYVDLDQYYDEGPLTIIQTQWIDNAIHTITGLNRIRCSRYGVFFDNVWDNNTGLYTCVEPHNQDI